MPPGLELLLPGFPVAVAVAVTTTLKGLSGGGGGAGLRVERLCPGLMIPGLLFR